MRTWDLSVPATVEKLARNQVHLNLDMFQAEDLVHYSTSVLTPQRRIRKAFKKFGALERFQGSEHIRELQRQLGLDPAAYTPATWKRTISKLVGVATKDDLAPLFDLKRRLRNRCLYVDSEGNRPDTQHPQLHACWKDSLVMPFYGLPGRIHALLVMGRLTPSLDDQVFMYYAQRRRPDAALLGDFGIGLLHCGLGKADPVFGTTVFVCTDPVWALRMQLRHLRSYNTPLPLVCTYTVPPFRAGATWHYLPQRPLIFWGPRHDASLLDQARSSGGRVGAQRWSAEEIAQLEPAQVLQSVYDRNVPWEDMVDSEFRRLPANEAEDLALKLDLAPPQLLQLADTARPDVAERLTALAKPAAERRARFQSHDILETEEGWFFLTKDGNERMTNALIRIDKVAYRPNQEQSIYIGRLLMNGGEAHFCEDADKIDPNPFKYFHHLSLASKLGVLYIRPVDRKNILALAHVFHQPTYHSALDKVGWDAERNAFVFPRFVLELNGEVKEAGDAELLPSGSVPCANLLPPTPLTEHDRQELNHGELASTVWAMAAGVAANVLAPLLGHPFARIGVVGDYALGTSIAEALGCRTQKMVAGVCPADSEKRYPTACAHYWPAIFTAHKYEQRNRVRPGELNLTPAYSIVPLQPIQARIFGMCPGWTMVEVPELKERPTALALKFAGSLLTRYLQDLACRDFALPAAPSVPAAILDDMAAWYRREGGRTHALHAAKELVRVFDETQLATLVRDFLIEEIMQGRIRWTEPSPCKERAQVRAKAAVTALGTDRVFIAKRLITNALGHGAGSVPDSAAISAAMQDAGVLVEERVIGDEVGWIVTWNWWQEGVTKWKSRQVPQLRTVG